MLFLIKCSKFLDHSVVVSFPLIFNNYNLATELRSQLILHILKLFQLSDLSYNSSALKASLELREGFVCMSFLSHLHVIKEVPSLFHFVTSKVV
jgi:hypothetical protein